MMEILTQHFSTEEIKKIEALPDYEAIKTKIEQMQAESLLDELSARVKASIAEAKTLEEKIGVFKESLGLIEGTESEDETEQLAPKGAEEVGDETIFSNLSLDAIKEKAREGVAGAQEYLEKKEAELLHAGEEKFRSGVKDSFIGKLLPEKFVNWIVETGKEKAQGKLEGIGGAIKGWIVGFLVSVIPGGKLLMSGYEKIFGENGEEQEKVDAPTEEKETKDEKGSKEKTTNDVVTENIEIEKISKARVAGYFLLSQISGFPLQKNSPQMGILEKINDQTPPISLIAMKGYLSQGNLKERLGLKETDYSEEDIFQVVLGMVGPVNEEFFEEQLSSESIQALIGKSPQFTDIGVQFFTEKELELIEENKFQYELLNVGILARLSVLSVRKQLALVASIPGEYAHKLSELFGDVLKSEEFESLTSSHEYPRGVSLAFEAILTENSQKSPEVLIETAQNKLEPLGESISEEEKRIIHDIVDYRSRIISEISEYSLDTHGFEEFIQERMSWGDILMLYALAQGKSLSNLNGFEELFVYTWVYGILDSEMKGKYQAQLVSQLLENKDENDSKVLTVLILRIIEIDRNIFLESIEQTKGVVDGTVGWVTGFNDIENDFLRNTLISLTEIGGITLAIKFLLRTPTFRAVLIATSGVVGTSIILGIKEKVYQDQSSAVGKYYVDFLKEVSPYMGYKNNYEKLIADVESGDLKSGEIFKRVANAPEEALTGIIQKLLPEAG